MMDSKNGLLQSSKETIFPVIRNPSLALGLLLLPIITCIGHLPELMVKFVNPLGMLLNI
uniref:Uncharacterized protein n=1 Tax=Anguilla anguilla TaxID=7936 RepID=A0A0E9V4B6_ANGAN